MTVLRATLGKGGPAALSGPGAARRARTGRAQGGGRELARARNARGTIGAWLADAVLHGLIALVCALPYRLRVPVMGWLVRRLLGPLAGYRRRARANLAMIHPDWTEERRHRVADGALDNFGRTLIEHYSGPELSRRMAGQAATGAGVAALAAAQAAGRPVILVSGHFGNTEAIRHLLGRQGTGVAGIYRPMANPFFNARYARRYAGGPGPVFERGAAGTRGFVRHLRGGGVAILLFDLHDYDGIALPFLGRPALTPTAAADLALRLDAAVIPAFAIRRPDGLDFDVVLEEPVAHAPPAGMMRAMTARLEARVAAHPDQWFWVHRRWKLPDPGDPPPGDQRSTAEARIAPGPGS
ncbi:MAG: lysophospholipid acyltransferase family protein [Rubellimicrobium sp.]|nr:lysophospholipid acyltransferase family protein [Rubellimicrobium sp.]